MPNNTAQFQSFSIKYLAKNVILFTAVKRNIIFPSKVNLLNLKLENLETSSYNSVHLADILPCSFFKKK